MKRAVIGTLAALVIVALFAFRYLPARGLKVQLDAIRAAGLPASPFELNAWYKSVGADENQALLIIEAAKLRVDAPHGADPLSGELGSLDAGQTLSPEMEEAMAAYLTTNEPALKLLHKAAELPASRYPLDLSLGANTLLPNLSQVKSMVQLLRLEVIQESHLGKAAEAVNSLNTAFVVAASLRDEPILISDLVRISCVAITLNGLERVLNEHQLTREQLAALSRRVAEAEAAGQPALFRALVGERADGVSIFDLSFQELDRLGATPQNGGGANILRTLGYQAYRASGLRQRDLSIYLETMEGFIKASKEELPVALQEFQRVEAAMTEQCSRGLGRLAIFTRMLIPALTKAASKEANLTARLRRTEVALAIEQFRLDHDGSPPDSLEQLAPNYLFKIPIDPFDGSPLIYERLSGKGYRVITSGAPAERSRSPKASKKLEAAGISVQR